MFKQNTRFLKDGRLYNGFGFPNALFNLTDPEVHRRRRKILNPHFSKQSIGVLEDMLYAKIRKLIMKIERISENGELIPVRNAFLSLTVSMHTLFDRT